jgi:hypothetical protein
MFASLYDGREYNYVLFDVDEGKAIIGLCSDFTSPVGEVTPILVHQ